MATGAWIDEDEEMMRSDSLTVLIESDPIATAAIMTPSSSDIVRAQQEKLEVHPLTLESAHHGNSSDHHSNNSTADNKLTNGEDTQKLLP